MKKMYVLCTISLILAFSIRIYAQTPAERQIARPKGTTSLGFGYYEYLPSNYSSATQLPVVIFFHGIGEKGNGTSELFRVLRNGPPKMVAAGKDFPFILLSVQHPSGWWNGTEVSTLVTYVKSTYKVDPYRVYVTGLSAGGFGTWTAGQSVASQLAAIVPICGCGQTQYAANMVNLPIWAFHNSGDGTVKSYCTIDMVKAVKTAGGNPKTTIYMSNSHDAWTATYNDQNMWDWLLAQRRGTTPVVNQTPFVNAGSDKTLTLPSNSITLTSTASDKDGSIVSYKWNKVSGPYFPATYTSTPTLELKGMVEGTYVFMMTVQDNQNAYAYDQVRVVVKPAPVANIAPTISAGEDKTITLPTNSTTFTATSADSDGTIASTTWTQVSGPASTMTNASSSTLSVSGLTVGTYVFRATVKDNLSATASDDVTLTVKAANIAPTVNAGADKTIQLPTSSVIFNASVSDSDGSIASTQWSQLTGSATTMTNSATNTLSVSGLVQGSYSFRLTVKDNAGAVSSDDVNLVVKAANIAPTVNAGTDVTITLPVDSQILAASVNDSDGSIATLKWTQISGPAVTTGSTDAATLNLSNLNEGIYTFEVTATDNQGATTTDAVSVTVNPAPNVAPTASAGNDRYITLPTDSLILEGSAVDSDGTVVKRTWTQVSGPTCTMTYAYTSYLHLFNLTEGTYSFKLEVIDNDGATATDEMTLTVKAATVSFTAPLVSAGDDRLIHLPYNTITMVGTSSAFNGTIVKRTWEQLEGPACTKEYAYTSYLHLSDLTAGTYVFKFTVVDSNGLSASDEATLIVNTKPTVNAGVDRTILLPKEMITIVATWSDVDGSVVSRKWVKVSGPATTLTDANTSYLKMTNFTPGVYVFKCTVKDNLGAYTSDEMQVTVIDPTTSRLSLNEITTPDFEIYPNPGSEKFRLDMKSDLEQDVEVKIISSTGEIVLQKEIAVNSISASQEINVQNLQSGVYLVRIKNNGGEKTVRFIKQ